MNNFDIFLCIGGMTLVTAIPRILPITLLAGRTLPPLLTCWLSFVPVSVLAALLAPELLLSGGTLNISTGNLFLLAALPTLLVSWFTKSFVGAVAVGMGTVALSRYFFV